MRPQPTLVLLIPGILHGAWILPMDIEIDLLFLFCYSLESPLNRGD